MIEKFFAWTWGLPEYAQFFFWLGVICFAIVLCGVALKMYHCLTRGSLFDRPQVGRARKFYLMLPWGISWRKGKKGHRYMTLHLFPWKKAAFQKLELAQKIRDNLMEEAALKFAASGDSSRFMTERDRIGRCDEPLHDHHDGCPACYMDEQARRTAKAIVNRDLDRMIADRLNGD